MKQHPTQLDKEEARMLKALAEKWGLPKTRYTSRAIARCIERVFQQEFMNADVPEDNKALQVTSARRDDFS